MKTVIVYLPLDAQKAKLSNLPVKLPVLAEDLDDVVKQNKLTKEVILRGLEAQVKTGKNLDYYLSYYVYHLYDKAREEMNRREFAKAREFIEKASKYLKDYRYPFHIGIIEREEGKLEASELLLKEAISMNEDFVPARLELARTLLAQGEAKDAIETCSEIFQIDPNFTLAYIIMGDAYMNLGDARSAIELYKHALKIDPNLPSVHWRIGVAANALQKFSLAEKEFKLSISKNEGGWQAKYNLSYSLFRLGKLFESLSLLRTLWDDGVKNAEVLTELILNQKLLGLYEEALDFVEEGMEMGFEGKEFLLASADIYAFNRLFEKSLEIYKKSNENEFETRKTLVEIERKCDVSISIEQFIGNLSFENRELSKRLLHSKEGLLSQDAFFDEEMLFVFSKVVSEFGEYPYTCERLLTQSGWAISGNVDTVALLLFLYRIYILKVLGGDLSEAVESAAISITDVSWKVGKALSASSDNDTYDLEENAPKRIESPSNAAVFFYMATRILDGHEDPIPFLLSLGTTKEKLEVLEFLLS